MPNALLRPCATQPCAELVESGHCPTHARGKERMRGSSWKRGYDRAWQAIRASFWTALIAAGIAPVCGARLPGAPVTVHSQCAREGRLNDRKLETDHIVPHRGDQRLFRDVLNLQLLCRRCHSIKTASEDGGFGR